MANLYNLQDKNPTVDSITFADGTKQETASSGGTLYHHYISLYGSYDGLQSYCCDLITTSNEPFTYATFKKYCADNLTYIDSSVFDYWKAGGIHAIRMSNNNVSVAGIICKMTGNNIIFVTNNLDLNIANKQPSVFTDNVKEVI